MSRHTISPPGWPATHEFVIGWDEPLATFFAQVIDTSISPSDDGILFTHDLETLLFKDVEVMLRVTNRRIEDWLTPIQLPPNLLRRLKKEASSRWPVISHIDITPEGQVYPALKPPVLTRPWQALGTSEGYLDAIALREFFDALGPQYFRLEDLYLAKKAAGLSEHTDARTRLIRHNLAQMETIGHLLGSLAMAPDILVAQSVMDAFSPIIEEAARVVEAESAPLSSTALVH